MLNAVGLANPGVETVATHALPWLARRLSHARVLVNVAGATLEDYERVLDRLADEAVVTRSKSMRPARTHRREARVRGNESGLTDLVRRARRRTRSPS
jgi:dihydroorotate dehydrogenase (NAD+) catalytic subunit